MNRCVTFRMLAALASVAIVVSACGDDAATGDITTTDAAAPTSPPPAPSDSSVADVASTTAGSVPEPSSAAVLPPLDLPVREPSSNPNRMPYAEAVGLYEGLGSDAARGEFPRVVRHALGETEISARPERVVVLDNGELDNLVSLRITPVGFLENGYVPAELTDVPRVGDGEPNLELIAALDPDLILTNALSHADLYDDLSQIAPTVMAPRLGVVFKENFRLYADALGEEVAAAEVEAAYVARVIELREVVADPPQQVSVVRVSPGELQIYQRSGFSGLILDDIGVHRPAGQNEDGTTLTISLEQFERLEGDLMVMFVDADTPAEELSAIVGSPLWDSLDVVSRGAVHEVDPATWLNAVGYTGAMAVLDDLERILQAS